MPIPFSMETIAPDKIRGETQTSKKHVMLLLTVHNF